MRLTSPPVAPTRERISLALDLHDEERIVAAVDELSDLVGYFKLNSAFTLFGPPLVRRILDRGAKVFLDLKLHDIPNTLAGYGEAVTQLGVHIVTTHVAGGAEMLKEFARSVEATARRLDKQPPKLIGITVMTSIGQAALNQEVGVPGKLEDEVLRKALIAASAGLDGIVCSVGELEAVRSKLPRDFCYVTPGVRPSGGSGHDHQRVYSYEQAAAAGSSLLVVGRSILNEKDPRSALLALHSALQGERR